jgi:hypothetical protein
MERDHLDFADATTMVGDRKLPHVIWLCMVKIGQTFSIRSSKMGLAAGRRSEEETDLRMRHLR